MPVHVPLEQVFTIARIRIAYHPQTWLVQKCATGPIAGSLTSVAICQIACSVAGGTSQGIYPTGAGATTILTQRAWCN